MTGARVDVDVEDRGDEVEEDAADPEEQHEGERSVWASRAGTEWIARILFVVIHCYLLGLLRGRRQQE